MILHNYLPKVAIEGLSSVVDGSKGGVLPGDCTAASAVIRSYGHPSDRAGTSRQNRADQKREQLGVQYT